VKLSLIVNISSGDYSYCEVGDSPRNVLAFEEGEPNAATRLAIVKAAAEIGKAMP